MNCRFDKLLLATIMMCFLSSKHLAQTSNFYTGGAHTLSLAEGGTMLDGISSIYSNPAGLTSISKYGIDLSYRNRFNLKELSTISIGGAKKFGSSYFGLSLSKYGYSEYSESKIGLLYARELFSNLSIGVGFNLLNYSINQYGTSRNFTFELGLQSKLNDNLSLGAYLFSPGAVEVREGQEIPTKFAIGLKYQASGKADLYVDISKTINRNPQFSFAVDYKMIEAFSFRIGANITQESLHFGPRYRFKNGMTILGSYAFDNRLGSSSALSISYSPN